MKTPESAIKNTICQWLELQHCLFWIQQAGKIPGRINRSRYLRNGIADILGCWQGRMLAIEVKAPGNKPTKEQTEFLNAVNEAGGLGFVAYDLDDVIRRLLKDVLVDGSTGQRLRATTIKIVRGKNGQREP